MLLIRVEGELLPRLEDSQYLAELIQLPLR